MPHPTVIRAVSEAANKTNSRKHITEWCIYMKTTSSVGNVSSYSHKYNTLVPSIQRLEIEGLEIPNANIRPTAATTITAANNIRLFENLCNEGCGRHTRRKHPASSNL